MEAIEKIKEVLVASVQGAQIEIIASTPAAAQPALLVDRDHVAGVARFLKEDDRFKMDFCSCVTGVDYPALGVIEVVYHLYSVALRQGPVVLKVRAPRDLQECHVPGSGSKTRRSSRAFSRRCSA